MKVLHKTLLASALLAILSAPAMADFAASETAAPAATVTRDIEVVNLANADQQAIADIQAPATELSIGASVDRADGQYRIGDNVMLNVQANMDANITVLNVGTSGKVTIIYPNEHQQDNRVKKGETVQIPAGKDDFALRLAGPAGQELIKVIATTGAGELINQGQTEKAGAFRSAKALGGKLAKDIEVVLREQQQAGNQWAEANLVINVASPAGVIAGVTPAQQAPIAAVQGGMAESPLKPAAEPLPAAGFELKLRTDKVLYYKGDEAKIYATAERDCRLTLIDVGSSGKVHVIFPNRYQPDNQIRAGQTVQVPADTAPVAYQINPPGGVEALIGICRTDDGATYPGQYDFKSHVFQPWGDSAKLAKDLEVVLREPKAALAHTATTFLVVED